MSGRRRMCVAAAVGLLVAAAVLAGCGGTGGGGAGTTGPLAGHVVTIGPSPNRLSSVRPVGLDRAQTRTAEVLITESGCLGCHRIGEQGNAGPGPDLTTVGARLNAAGIRRALTHPGMPVPAVANLSHQQRSALVVFLAHLR